MAAQAFQTLKGHCTCKAITFEVLAPFFCVSCCHCKWCQRETGSAFATNGFVEASNLRVTSATEPIHIETHTASGRGQLMSRCPTCYVVLYSDYDRDGTIAVRMGALDDDGKKTIKLDSHIFISSKMDWVDLTSDKEKGIPIWEAYPPPSEMWSKEAMERLDVLKQKMDALKRTEEETDQGKEDTKS